MAAYTAAQVAEFLGKPGDSATEAYATTALAVIASMAESYTRGEGFSDGAPADDIAAAIFTATLRFMANKTQLEHSKIKGPFSVDYRSSFTGWSIAETFVLNRYRKRAE